MKILTVVGTRPEAIKLAPVILELNRSPVVESAVCVSGQHRIMAEQALMAFDIEADIELQPAAAATLTQTVAHLAVGLEGVIREFSPDCVVVHGDTATSLAASLASYFNRTKIAHVEAGLRTGDLYSPWPEEGNRKMTGVIADIHFAPTEGARQSLISENIPPDSILVTGNTVIDALLQIKERIDTNPLVKTLLTQKFEQFAHRDKIIIVTAHRRENVGQGIREICEGVARLSRRYPEIGFVMPVHPNPEVSSVVRGWLCDLENVTLIDPVDYIDFVYLMMKSDLILTDSGGIQEEAPALGIPVLVMRDVTERPEAIAAGTARLIGADADAIYRNVIDVLSDRALYASMATARNPFGDGHAAGRIREHLIKRLSIWREGVAPRGSETVLEHKTA